MYTRKRGFNLTMLLIIINIAVFIAIIALVGALGEEFFYLVAVQPAAILAGQRLWTMITNIFVHASFLHLFVNMLSLYFLGNFLERLIGKKRLFWAFIIGGIVSAAFFVFLASASQALIPAVGASGAIFCLAGILAIITPRVPVYVMFIPVAIPLWIGVVIALVVMWIASIAAGLPIGNTAHLGGLVAGVVYGIYLRKKYSRKVHMLDKYFRRIH
ncbi:MAG: rhomboid family intramembrane serine protease [archaeon]|nr:MAG: rhomboid family intramembrane serine protease [archaeon]